MIRFIRLFHAHVLLLVGSAIGLLLVIFFPRQKNSMWLASLFFKTKFFELVSGIRFEIDGMENFAKADPAIIVSNHQSNIDAAFMAKLFRKGTVVIGKKELNWIPIFGQLFYLAGNIAIDRANRTKSVNSLNDVALAIKQKSLSIWIMPEGTRGKGPHTGLKQFKKGAFYTAINAKVPIIPVCANNFITDSNWNSLWRPVNIKIRVLEPVATEGMNNSDAGQLLEDCFKKMQQIINTF